MYTASLLRAARRISLVLLFLAQAHVALAQTTSDPTVLEFAPSPDHLVLAADRTPLVTEYLLALYVAGQPTALSTTPLGKPNPGADGKIRVNFISLLAPLSPGVLYEAKVMASGPGGVTGSLVSNRFDYSVVCSASLTPGSMTMVAGGGSGSVAVGAATGCLWSTTSDAAWLSTTGSASGTGPGIVAFTATPNTGQGPRTGVLTIGWRTFTVTQSAPPCAYTLSATSQGVPATGGTGGVSLTGATGCTWTATSNAAWLTVTAGASGSGSGTVGFSAAANSGSQSRTGTLTVGGQTFTVLQPGVPCAVSIAPSSLPLYAQVAAIGADSYVWQESTDDVRAPQRAVTGRVMSAWYAEAFSIDVNMADTQPHQVALYMADYDGYGRAQRIDVVDAGGVVLDSRTVSEFTGGQYLVWTVQGRVTFRLTKVGGNNAVVSAVLVGPGTAAVAGAPATSATFVRTDTTTLGNWRGVYGSAGYVIVADATSTSLLAAAGAGAVAVTAPTGCTWTAASNQPWLTVPASGSGNATVGFNVTANTSGTPRSGTLTIGGQTLTWTQASSSCGYTVSGTPQTLGAAAGSGSVTVGALTGCAWTATSSDAWLTVTAGATGSGAGTVTFGAAANAGPSLRTATLTVAGQAILVTQAAPTTCAYALSATGQTLAAAAGGGSVNVTAGAGCAWTTASSAGWLTVTSGASGSGGGTVVFSAYANPATSARTGTLTIAGRSFTVTQEGAPCAYTLSATSQALTAAAGGGSVNVTAGAGCAWTAVSSAAWLTVTAGASGSGSGAVAFSALANAGTTSRTGTITIAGRAVTVTQAAPGSSCSIVLTPETQSLNLKRYDGTILVAAGSGCSWTAKSSAAWLTVTGVSVAGGTVAFSITRNGTGAPRTATITVGTVSATITQRVDTLPNPVTGFHVVQ